MLNSFAPPFFLVGGYFLVGGIGLIASVLIFGFIDLSDFADFSVVGWVHSYAIGFVMSIIIGSLYQLISVILERAFYTLFGSYLNLIAYIFALIFFIFGFLQESMFFIGLGGLLIALSLLYFALCYFATFLVGGYDGFKQAISKSFAAFSLFCSSIYLISGIVFGILLILYIFGIVQMDFDILLRYHMYFMGGFILLVIIGSASVLLPMFTLAHGLKFHLFKISLSSYILSGFWIFTDDYMSLILIGICIFAMLFEIGNILYRRVRRRLDYYNLNIAVSIIFGFLSFLFFNIGLIEYGIFSLFFGFLFCFIVAHIYKILPFLIWFHYVSPFVGKKPVPLLDNMIIKPLAYFALCCSLFGVIFYIFSIKALGLTFIITAAVCLMANMIGFAKYINFKDIK